MRRRSWQLGVVVLSIGRAFANRKERVRKKMGESEKRSDLEETLKPFYQRASEAEVFFLLFPIPFFHLLDFPEIFLVPAFSLRDFFLGLRNLSWLGLIYYPLSYMSIDLCLPAGEDEGCLLLVRLASCGVVMNTVGFYFWNGNHFHSKFLPFHSRLLVRWNLIGFRDQILIYSIKDNVILLYFFWGVIS